MVNKILVYYENHGYPFATVKFDSVLVTASTISLSLNVSKNKMISIDSLLVLGDLKVSKSFLHHYFQVKQGGLYNEEAIRNISQKLKQLPFAKEVKPVIVKLTDKSNKIYFFVSKKNASQFDGIIGLLPSQTGKTIFTGDVKVKLINTVFKSGETIELNWRRLQSQTQDLQTHIHDLFQYSNNFPNDTNLYVRLINGFHWIYTNPYLFINSGLKEKKTNLDKDTGKSTRLIRCGEELLSNYTRNDRFDLKKNTII